MARRKSGHRVDGHGWRRLGCARRTTTDANGKTSTDWTLGTTAGGNALTAAISGATSVTINAVAPPPPWRVEKVSPDSQLIVPTASVPLVVRSVDKYGNACRASA